MILSIEMSFSICVLYFSAKDFITKLLVVVERVNKKAKMIIGMNPTNGVSKNPSKYIFIRKHCKKPRMT